MKLYYEKGIWTVVEDFTVHDITIPAGFQTDLATIPKFFWSIYPPFGRYERATIVHDYLYTYTDSRLVSDITFYKIMKEDGVSFVTRSLFFIFARLFGGKYDI